MSENKQETANVAVPQKKERSVFGHPAGLMLLFFTEMAERFSYYGMRPLFKLYLISALFENKSANSIYGAFTGLVYLTPMLGGFISDRYWGNRRSIIFGGVLMAIGEFLLFFSAMIVKKAVYIENGPIDPKVDNTFSTILLGLGVLFLIFGNGFFKPNISTMVGDLYEPSDERKDSAYTIFYMGVNLGAFFAPFVCGSLAPSKEGYKDPQGFKWGFFAAGVGMVLSLLAFIFLKNKLIVTPEGDAIGLPPSQDKVKAKRLEENKLLEKTLKAEEGEKEEAKDDIDNKVGLRAGISALVGLAIALIYYFFLADLPENPKAMNYIVEVIFALIFACFIGLPIYIITDRHLNGNEKARISVIYIIAGFAIFFWSAYEQAATSLTDAAELASDRHIFGWEIPTAFLQSVNPFFIVVLAPIFAYMWETLNKHGKEPASVTKQGLGFVILALSYVFISVGYKDYKFFEGEKKSIWWVIILYFIQTLGELCLSPIGNSLVYKLSPPHLCSLLMGVWLMSSAVSNVFASMLANYAPSAAPKDPVTGKPIFKTLFGITMDTFSKFFNIFIVMNAVGGIVFFCLVPFLKRQMRGIK